MPESFLKIQANYKLWAPRSVVLPVLIPIGTSAPDTRQRRHYREHQERGEQGDLRGQIAEMLASEQVIQAAPHRRRQHHEDGAEHREGDADVVTFSLTLFAADLIGDADGAAGPCDDRQLRIGVSASNSPQQVFAAFWLVHVARVLHQRASAMAALGTLFDSAFPSVPSVFPSRMRGLRAASAR